MALRPLRPTEPGAISQPNAEAEIQAGEASRVAPSNAAPLRRLHVSAPPAGYLRLRRLLASLQENGHYRLAAITAALLGFHLLIQPLDLVTLGLAGIGLSPWIVPLLRRAAPSDTADTERMARLEELAAEAGRIGLLAEPEKTLASRDVYESLLDEDPALAVAKLRVELERRLFSLATYAKVDRPRQGMIWLLHELERTQALTAAEAKVVGDLLPLLNAALHAGTDSIAMLRWTTEVGPRLVAGIGRRIEAPRLPLRRD